MLFDEHGRVHLKYNREGKTYQFRAEHDGDIVATYHAQFVSDDHQCYMGAKQVAEKDLLFIIDSELLTNSEEVVGEFVASAGKYIVVLNESDRDHSIILNSKINEALRRLVGEDTEQSVNKYFQDGVAAIYEVSSKDKRGGGRDAKRRGKVSGAKWRRTGRRTEEGRVLYESASRPGELRVRRLAAGTRGGSRRYCYVVAAPARKAEKTEKKKGRA